MKLKPFYALLIITLFLLILFVPKNIAQTKSNENEQTNEEKEKLEVQKFVDSFYKTLEDTKDLQKVSESFFVTDFKTRFGKAYENSDVVDPQIFNKLNEIERFNFHSVAFNSFYMGIMHNLGKSDIDDENESESNDWDWFAVENLVTPQILGMIKNSKWLNAYFFKDDDENESEYDLALKNVKELREFISEIKDMTYAQRISLDNRFPEQKKFYDKNIRKLRKEAYYYQSEACSKDCERFPKKSQIINLREFPLEVRIVRQNGNLKIFHITISVSD